MTWSIRSSADGRGLDLDPSADSTNGTTRLIRAIRDFQNKLGAKVREIRKNFSMKLFFFLVGFYCATAFATVIGQTGDWDILSAALAVVVVEGIGALMYRASLPVFSRARSLISMFNYWKAGLSLGLFLDSFKYWMDDAIGFQAALHITYGSGSWVPVAEMQRFLLAGCMRHQSRLGSIFIQSNGPLEWRSSKRETERTRTLNRLAKSPKSFSFMLENRRACNLTWITIPQRILGGLNLLVMGASRISPKWWNSLFQVFEDGNNHLAIILQLGLHT